MLAFNGNWRECKDYVPASPSDSAQVRALAQQRLDELRNPALLENKHAFLEQLQNTTHELLGIPPKPTPRAASLAPAQTTQRTAPTLEAKPLPDELRRPSAHALQSIREMRGRTLASFNTVLLPSTANHEATRLKEPQQQPPARGVNGRRIQDDRKSEPRDDSSFGSIRSEDGLDFRLSPGITHDPSQEMPARRQSDAIRQYQHTRELASERSPRERSIHAENDEPARLLDNVKDCFQHCFNDESYVIDGEEVISISALSNALLRKAKDDPAGEPTYRKVLGHLQRYAEQSGRRMLPSSVVDRLTREAILAGENIPSYYHGEQRPPVHQHQHQQPRELVFSRLNAPGSPSLESQYEEPASPRSELEPEPRITSAAFERPAEEEEAEHDTASSPTSERPTADDSSTLDAEEEWQNDPSPAPTSHLDEAHEANSRQATAAPENPRPGHLRTLQPSDEIELDLRGNYRPTNAELLRESLDLSHCSSQKLAGIVRRKQR